VDFVIFRECIEGFYADRNMLGDIRSDKVSELDQAARAIESAIDAALQDPATRTADLGGRLGTRAFAGHVAALIG